MATAAERKRRQRERDATTIWEVPYENWTERHCLAVLTDPRWRTDTQAMAKAAWERLGQIRGFL